jgi:hypothetical protein
MGPFLATKQEELIASLKALFSDKSLHAEQQQLCIRCGAVMQYLDATFSLYESDFRWSVRLPYCPCDETLATAVRIVKKRAS